MNVQTFSELAAWLVRQIDNLDADCNDGETIGAIGIHAHRRSEARVSAYRDVLHEIAPAILLEIAEQRAVAAEDSAEARYKEAGYDGLEPVIARYADGDR